MISFTVIRRYNSIYHFNPPIASDYNIYLAICQVCLICPTSYLNSKSIKTTVGKAEDAGYSPCKVCNPYGLVNEHHGIDYNNSKDDSMNWYLFLFGIIFLTIFYMTIPISLKVLEVKFETINGIKYFIIANNLIIFFILLMSITDFSNYEIFEQLVLTVIYGFINYYVLKDNINLHHIRMK